MRIHRLGKDYTSFTGETRDILVGQAREAPAVFRVGRFCFMVTSGCTGWLPNSMLYATADAVLGNWRLIGDPCTGLNARHTL